MRRAAEFAPNRERHSRRRAPTCVRAKEAIGGDRPRPTAQDPRDGRARAPVGLAGSQLAVVEGGRMRRARARGEGGARRAVAHPRSGERIIGADPLGDDDDAAKRRKRDGGTKVVRGLATFRFRLASARRSSRGRPPWKTPKKRPRPGVTRGQTREEGSDGDSGSSWTSCTRVRRRCAGAPRRGARRVRQARREARRRDGRGNRRRRRHEKGRRGGGGGSGRTPTQDDDPTASAVSVSVSSEGGGAVREERRTWGAVLPFDRVRGSRRR